MSYTPPFNNVARALNNVSSQLDRRIASLDMPHFHGVFENTGSNSPTTYTTPSSYGDFMVLSVDTTKGRGNSLLLLFSGNFYVPTGAPLCEYAFRLVKGDATLVGETHIGKGYPSSANVLLCTIDKNLNEKNVLYRVQLKQVSGAANLQYWTYFFIAVKGFTG